MLDDRLTEQRNPGARDVDGLEAQEIVGLSNRTCGTAPERVQGIIAGGYGALVRGERLLRAAEAGVAGVLDEAVP